MHIELKRTPFPEDVGDKADCAICAGDFEVGIVSPMLLGEGRMDEGTVCPSCVAFLGEHPSGRFPTLADYWRLEAEWGTPRYASVEEADKALGF
jgi:hypothetical protein